MSTAANSFENKNPSKKQNPRGGAKGKTAIIGMRERDGRVKAMPIEDGKGDTLKKAVRDNILLGSTIFTDENRSYVHLGDKYGGEYKHECVKHSAKEFVNGMAHTTESRACGPFSSAGSMASTITGAKNIAAPISMSSPSG